MTLSNRLGARRRTKLQRPDQHEQTVLDPTEERDQLLRRLRFQWLHPIQFYRLQKKRAQENASGYSYRQFDEHKCIFVHIPKCAGVSVSKSLFGNLGGGHTSIKTYQLIFSAREFRSYFKFTIVRNPWDRIVSAFRFLKAGGFSGDDRRWAQEHLAPYPDFNSFVQQWLTRDNIRTEAHFRPQLDFICGHHGEPLIDFIGYYENLEADFGYICRRIGIHADLPRLNANQLQESDYKDFYSRETRDKVAEIYADDINHLGYSFDNSSLRNQLASRSRAASRCAEEPSAPQSSFLVE